MRNKAHRNLHIRCDGDVLADIEAVTRGAPASAIVRAGLQALADRIIAGELQSLRILVSENIEVPGKRPST